ILVGGGGRIILFIGGIGDSRNAWEPVRYRALIQCKTLLAVGNVAQLHGEGALRRLDLQLRGIAFAIQPNDHTVPYDGSDRGYLASKQADVMCRDRPLIAVDRVFALESPGLDRGDPRGARGGFAV